MTTAYGEIRVKLALLDGAVRSAAPEYDDCRAAAGRHGVPIGAVYAAATDAARTAGADSARAG